jgi:hypothetical protein
MLKGRTARSRPLIVGQMRPGRQQSMFIGMSHIKKFAHKSSWRILLFKARRSASFNPE